MEKCSSFVPPLPPFCVCMCVRSACTQMLAVNCGTSEFPTQGNLLERKKARLYGYTVLGTLSSPVFNSSVLAKSLPAQCQAVSIL